MARIVSVCLLRTSCSQVSPNANNTTSCVSGTYFLSFFYPNIWFVLSFIFFVSYPSPILNTSFFTSLLLSLFPVYHSSCVHSFFIDFLPLTFTSLFISSIIYLSYVFPPLLLSFLHSSFLSLFLSGEERISFLSTAPTPQLEIWV